MTLPPGYTPGPEATAFRDELILLVNKYIEPLKPEQRGDGKTYMQVLGILFAEAAKGLQASGVPLSDAMQLLGAAYGAGAVFVHEQKVPVPKGGDA